MKMVYPLTITCDRYSGTYSGGLYIAWNMRAFEVPTEPFLDDATCFGFWLSYDKSKCAVGNTIEEAIENLRNKLESKS